MQLAQHHQDFGIAQRQLALYSLMRQVAQIVEIAWSPTVSAKSPAIPSSAAIQGMAVAMTLETVTAHLCTWDLDQGL